PDHTVKWLSWAAKFNNEKWFASGRDVSYQKQVVKELKQLSLVASKVSNGVVISNAADEVVWVNDAFEHITGYNLADVENKHIATVLKGKPVDNAAIEKLESSIKKKES